MELFSSYTGADFLAFYLILLVTCVAASFWIPVNLRPRGTAHELDEAEEMAVLVAGPKRHAHTVATDLMVQGGLANASSGKLRVAKNGGIQTGSAGRSVLRKVGDFDMRELCFTTAADADAIERKLIDRGLLMNEDERSTLRWFSVSPCIALFLLGLYRAIAGYGEGEAIGFLVALMLVTVLIAGWRFSAANSRTTAGNTNVWDAQTAASRLRLAPQPHEAGYAVALFGTGVLIGTPWEAVHAMQTSAVASMSNAGGCGGGCGGDNGGGSGCGGGGCGGCGG